MLGSAAVRVRCRLLTVTSSTYGEYAYDYTVEGKLRRVLPKGWHVDPAKDNIASGVQSH
jgi:hypothetical protein